MSQDLSNVQFTPVKTGGTYVKAKSLAEQGITGEILIGNLKSQTENEYGKSYAFTLAKPVELGDIAAAGEGDTIIVNGTSSLDRQMAEVSEGTLCRLSYAGMLPAKNGKSFHSFNVETA